MEVLIKAGESPTLLQNTNTFPTSVFKFVECNMATFQSNTVSGGSKRPPLHRKISRDRTPLVVASSARAELPKTPIHPFAYSASTVSSVSSENSGDGTYDVFDPLEMSQPGTPFTPIDPISELKTMCTADISKVAPDASNFALTIPEGRRQAPIPSEASPQRPKKRGRPPKKVEAGSESKVPWNQSEIERQSERNNMSPPTTAILDSGDQCSDDCVEEYSMEDSCDESDHTSEPDHRPKFNKFATSSQNSRQVNHHMFKHLTDKRKASSKKAGWVYVLKSSTEKHIKIGQTYVTPEKRRQEWEKCGISVSEVEIGHDHGDAFFHYSIVEHLIMAELHNMRRKFKCKPCDKEHNEWYAIDVELALKLIRRWKRWIVTQKPFEKDGTLTAYWHWKVHKLPLSLDKVDWDLWVEPDGYSHFKDVCNYYGELYGKENFRKLRTHLGRKDGHFIKVGMIIALVVQILFGGYGLTFVVLSLMAL